MSKSNGFKIEKGIPVAEQRRDWSFIESMKVGDSFLIPDCDVLQNTRVSIYQVFKTRGLRAAVRTVDGGLRVWRTK